MVRTNRPKFLLWGHTISIHSSPFELITLFIILFTFANGRLCQGNANHRRSFKAAGNGIIESIHVVRKETLADGSQAKNLLFAVCHYLCLTYGCS